ncbi:MAG TPA: hypothetical protein VK699_06045 [Terriglobales bacterium]|nr:hypothetical protein [Terriglobales bacterium]
MNNGERHSNNYDKGFKHCPSRCAKKPINQKQDCKNQYDKILQPCRMPFSGKLPERDELQNAIMPYRVQTATAIQITALPGTTMLNLWS